MLVVYLLPMADRADHSKCLAGLQVLCRGVMMISINIFRTEDRDNKRWIIGREKFSRRLSVGIGLTLNPLQRRGLDTD
jgi:hypothetical protein